MTKKERAEEKAVQLGSRIWMKNYSKESSIKNLENQKKILGAIDWYDPKKHLFPINHTGQYLLLKATSLKELAEIRKFLRSIVKDYSDKVVSVYTYDDTKGYASYEVKSGTVVQNWVVIWLVRPFEKFPTLKPGCGFKKIEREVEVKAEVKKIVSWEYSCSKKEGQE